ncbi:MAG: hypothetical protein J7M06_03755, partial [Proteobacteria bacterium]|nr:hypothetical protein [Pseudomonadota bacterium]
MNDRNDPPPCNKPEKDCGDKLDRREFFKLGAAGAAMGLTTVMATKKTLAAKVYSDSKTKELDEFPNKITDQCKPFDQKYTVFARGLWDPEIKPQMMKFATAPTTNASGYTHLDKALYNAGWAVEYRFSEWSMNGQPDTDAYQWHNWTNPEKYEFESPEDASKKVKKAAKFLGASLV